MIYLTADLHGDLDRLQQVRKPLRRHDSLIVLGDFGFIWNGSKAEQKLLRRLGKGKGTLLFLDGAHENFDLLAEYPVVEFAGGQARKLGERLYQLLRGECYTIEGRRLRLIRRGDGGLLRRSRSGGRGLLTGSQKQRGQQEQTGKETPEFRFHGSHTSDQR